MTRTETTARLIKAVRTTIGFRDRYGYRQLSLGALREALADYDRSTPDSEGGWRPIETLPNDVTHCLVGHAPSSTMLVAQRTAGNRDWKIMWTVGRTLMWEPTHWMPPPAPPAQEPTP